MKNADLFLDLGATAAAALFLETAYPWEVLPRIGAFVRALGPTLRIGDDQLHGVGSSCKLVWRFNRRFPARGS